MKQQPDSLGYKNFNEKYAVEQFEHAVSECDKHEYRVRNAKKELESEREELNYWESIRDFYAKAKEAEQ
jgi:hypothetical protein